MRVEFFGLQGCGDSMGRNHGYWRGEMRKGGLNPVRALSKRVQRMEWKVTIKDVVDELMCIGLGCAVRMSGAKRIDLLQ